MISSQKQMGGVLSVIKSDKSLSSIEKYLESTGIGSFSTITIIFSRGKATSNSVIIVSRDLYNHLRNQDDNVIYDIEPYVISDTHIPSQTQTMDIFLKFESSHYGRKNILENYVKHCIEQLRLFEIIDESLGDNFYSIQISYDADHGFVKFKKQTPLDVCIYIRSILNGHIINAKSIYSEYSNIRISAFWCSKYTSTL